MPWSFLPNFDGLHLVTLTSEKLSPNKVICMSFQVLHSVTYIAWNIKACNSFIFSKNRQKPLRFLSIVAAAQLKDS